MTRWLWRGSLLLLPLALAAHLLRPDSPAAVFALSALSLMPLAKGIGDATEELAERTGPTAGSLLNVTFGNAAELIVGISALSRGHVDLVKGSLTGSIVANLLLVGGAAIVAGGARFPTLRFNRTSAGMSSALDSWKPLRTASMSFSSTTTAGLTTLRPS